MTRSLSYKSPTGLDHFYYGAPYYPEHWDARTRAADAERMAAAHFNCVRMAEFAWDQMEPQEGHFDFSLFDETIQKMGKKGIKSMLCTPTATPPRWLTEKFPGMLRVDAKGVTLQHGSRQHVCYSSDPLRAYSQKITRAMAEHYKDNADVIGWQTDNEFNCHFRECHCESCQRDFRVFLRHKYHDDVQALNRAWGTSFWGQTYTSFEQINTPREGLPTYPNPSQVLDYDRYVSWSVVRFQKDQVDILREANPGWFITHNGTYPRVDYRALAQDLDFLGYDSYPFFNFKPSTRRFSQSFGLDKARAWAGNFIIPEQQSGPGGQGGYFHDTPEPGEMRRMAYTSIARGADSLLFFRWRTARFGAEEYWFGILDHDNVPRRRYHEAAQLGDELKRVGPAVLGTWVKVTAGVAAADIDVTDAHEALSLGLPSPDEMAATAHACFEQQGFAAGCVHPGDDLSDLEIYVVSSWALFDPQWVPNLTEFVAKGGILVIGARTATKDLNNNVSDQTAPGVLRDLAGVSVEESGRQNAPDERPLWVYFQSEQYQTHYWYEILNPDAGTEVIATWKGRHLKGRPAATLHRVGQGIVIYVGCYLTDEIITGLFSEVDRHRELTKLWPFAPEGVEVVKRQDDEKELWFFINHKDAPATIPSIPEDGINLISGQAARSPLILAPNDVAVIQTPLSATPAI